MSFIAEAFHMPFTRRGQSVFPGGPGGRLMPQPTGKREQVKRPGGFTKPDKAQLSMEGTFRKQPASWLMLVQGRMPHRRLNVVTPEQ